MSEVDLAQVREEHPLTIHAPFDCATTVGGPCSTRQLADEVELGNSAISKQIEVNSGLREENALLREALGFYADEENWEEPVWTGTRGGPRPAPAHEDAGDEARAALPKDEDSDGS